MWLKWDLEAHQSEAQGNPGVLPPDNRTIKKLSPAILSRFFVLTILSPVKRGFPVPNTACTSVYYFVVHFILLFKQAK